MLYSTSDTSLTEGNNGAYPTAATNLVASSPLGLPLPRCGQANHCPKQRPVRPTLGTVVGKPGMSVTLDQGTALLHHSRLCRVGCRVVVWNGSQLPPPFQDSLYFDILS